MKDTLTKENFWDNMEQKYPKATAHFKEWIDKYKSEHNWEELFNEHDDGVLAMGVAPKYHELPVAMQFGIFMEYFHHLYKLKDFNLNKISRQFMFVCMNSGPGNTIAYVLGYINEEVLI